MKKVSFAVLIGVDAFFLLLFSFVAIPFVSFDYPVLFSNPLKISIVMLEIIIIIVALLFSIYGLIFTLRLLFNPHKHFLASLAATDGRKSLQHRLEMLSKSINVFLPTLLESDHIPDVFTFGLSKDNSYVIVSPSFLDELDEDETETVLLHELFHVKEDVEYQSFKVAFQKVAYAPFNFIYVPLAFMVILLLFPFFFSGRGLPPIIYDKFEAVYPLWTTFGLLVLLPLGLVLMTLTAVKLFRERSELSRSYLYIRELLADSYSAIISGRPLKTYSAVVKASKRRILLSDRTSYDKIGFAYSPEKETETLGDISLADIFKIRVLPVLYIFGLRGGPANVSSPIIYRLGLLKVLQQMIYGNVNIIYLDRSQQSILSLSQLRMPDTVANVLRKKKVFYREFCEYAAMKRSSFNLIECAHAMKVEPFEAFLMLYAAISSGIFDIKVET